MITLLPVMQRACLCYYTIITYYYVIITPGSIITHYYLFQSPELADGSLLEHLTSIRGIASVKIIPVQSAQVIMNRVVVALHFVGSHHFQIITSQARIYG